MRFLRGQSGRFGNLDTFVLDVEEGGTVKPVPFPSLYFQAPQFYYRNYPDFPLTPRQVQLCLIGTAFYPVMIELPRFSSEQKAYSRYLRESIRVQHIYVHVGKFEEYLEAAKQIHAVGPPSQRQPGEEPVKGLFHPSNVTNTAEEALERFNEKYNSGYSGTAARLVSQSKRESSRTMMQAFSSIGLGTRPASISQSGILGPTQGNVEAATPSETGTESN